MHPTGGVEVCLVWAHLPITSHADRRVSSGEMIGLPAPVRRVRPAGAKLPVRILHFAVSPQERAARDPASLLSGGRQRSPRGEGLQRKWGFEGIVIFDCKGLAQSLQRKRWFWTRQILRCVPPQYHPMLLYVYTVREKTPGLRERERGSRKRS